MDPLHRLEEISRKLKELQRLTRDSPYLQPCGLQQAYAFTAPARVQLPRQQPRFTNRDSAKPPKEGGRVQYVPAPRRPNPVTQGGMGDLDCVCQPVRIPKDRNQGLGKAKLAKCLIGKGCCVRREGSTKSAAVWICRCTDTGYADGACSQTDMSISPRSGKCSLQKTTTACRVKRTVNFRDDTALSRNDPERIMASSYRYQYLACRCKRRERASAPCPPRNCETPMSCTASSYPTETEFKVLPAVPLRAPKTYSSARECRDLPGSRRKGYASAKNSTGSLCRNMDEGIQCEPPRQCEQECGTESTCRTYASQTEHSGGGVRAAVSTECQMPRQVEQECSTELACRTSGCQTDGDEKRLVCAGVVTDDQSRRLCDQNTCTQEQMRDEACQRENECESQGCQYTPTVCTARSTQAMQPVRSASGATGQPADRNSRKATVNRLLAEVSQQQAEERQALQQHTSTSHFNKQMQDQQNSALNLAPSNHEAAPVGVDRALSSLIVPDRTSAHAALSAHHFPPNTADMASSGHHIRGLPVDQALSSIEAAKNLSDMAHSVSNFPVTSLERGSSVHRLPPGTADMAHSVANFPTSALERGSSVHQLPPETTDMGSSVHRMPSVKNLERGSSVDTGSSAHNLTAEYVERASSVHRTSVPYVDEALSVPRFPSELVDTASSVHRLPVSYVDTASSVHNLHVDTVDQASSFHNFPAETVDQASSSIDIREPKVDAALSGIFPTAEPVATLDVPTNFPSETSLLSEDRFRTIGLSPVQSLLTRPSVQSVLDFFPSEPAHFRPVQSGLRFENVTEVEVQTEELGYAKPREQADKEISTPTIDTAATKTEAIGEPEKPTKKKSRQSRACRTRRRSKPCKAMSPLSSTSSSRASSADSDSSIGLAKSEGEFVAGLRSGNGLFMDSKYLTESFKDGPDKLELEAVDEKFFLQLEKENNRGASSFGQDHFWQSLAGIEFDETERIQRPMRPVVVQIRSLYDEDDYEAAMELCAYGNNSGWQGGDSRSRSDSIRRSITSRSGSRFREASRYLNHLNPANTLAEKPEAQGKLRPDKNRAELVAMCRELWLADPCTSPEMGKLSDNESCFTLTLCSERGELPRNCKITGQGPPSGQAETTAELAPVQQYENQEGPSQAPDLVPLQDRASQKSAVAPSEPNISALAHRVGSGGSLVSPRMSVTASERHVSGIAHRVRSVRTFER